jgi:hypothetical protein
MSTAPAPATQESVEINKAISVAKNLPDLIARAQAVDPSLAAALTGKALIASKTPWGNLLATAIAYIVAKYGLGWSESFDELIAGAALVGMSYIMRLVSPARVTGLFKSAPVTSTTTTTP